MRINALLWHIILNVTSTKPGKVCNTFRRVEGYVLYAQRCVTFNYTDCPDRHALMTRHKACMVETKPDGIHSSILYKEISK